MQKLMEKAERRLAGANKETDINSCARKIIETKMRDKLKLGSHVQFIANDSIQNCSILSHRLEIYSVTQEWMNTKESARQIAPWDPGLSL